MGSMRTLARSLVFAASLLSAARADDLPVNSVAAIADQNGRYELFAIATDGRLYQRPQVNSSAPAWGDWVGLGSGSVIRLALAQSATSHEIFAASISGGKLQIQHQGSAAGAISGAPITLGEHLSALALASRAGGKMEAYVIGEAGTLGRFQEGETAWSKLQNLGGHNLMGGSIPGSLSGFHVLPNALAAALSPDNSVHAFAVGGDGVLYDHVQPAEGEGAWVSLEGTALVDVSAVAPPQGTISVFALDKNNNLSSRTQATDNTFGPWVPVFAQAVSAWSAAAGTDGTITVVGQTSEGPKAVTLLAERWSSPTLIRSADGWGLGNALPSPLVINRNQSALFALDGAGGIYQLPASAAQIGQTFEGADRNSWEWLGGATVNPNPEDIAMQFEKCLPADLNSVLIGSLQNGLSGQLADTPLQPLTEHVSVLSTCNDSGQTLGAWLSRVPTTFFLTNLKMLSPPGHGAESIALAVTWPALERAFAIIWAGLDKTYDLAGKFDRHGEVLLKSYTLGLHGNSLVLTIHGSVSNATSLTITASAVISVMDFAPSCEVKIKVSSPLDAIVTGFAGGADIATAFGLYDGFATLLKEGIAGVASSQTPTFCNITKAIPTVLTPAPHDVNGLLEKFTFTYDRVVLDHTLGVRFFSQNPPSPSPRHPQVIWYELPGAFQPRPLTLLIHLIAQETDFWQPSPIQWTTTWPGASVTALNPTGTMADILFSIPKNIALKKLNLGTLTATVTDDGNSYTDTARLVINDFVLATPPKQVKPPRPPQRVDQ